MFRDKGKPWDNYNSEYFELHANLNAGLCANSIPVAVSLIHSYAKRDGTSDGPLFSTLFTTILGRESLGMLPVHSNIALKQIFLFYVISLAQMWNNCEWES